MEVNTVSLVVSYYSTVVMKVSVENFEPEFILLYCNDCY